MLNIGRARHFITIQVPTSGTDGMGAPTVTWADYATAYAEIENEQVDQAESTQSGPRRELTKSFTYIIRCHQEQSFTPAMRALDSNGSTYQIISSRYNERRDTAYLDVSSGVSAGGVP